MITIWEYIKSLRIILWVFFFVTIFGICCIEFIIPEATISNYSNIFNLIENFSLAYLSAFLFYVVVVHIKEQDEIKMFKPYIINYSKQLLQEANSLKSHLSKASGVELKLQNISEENIRIACNKICVHTKVNIIFGIINDSPTWWQFLIYFKEINLKLINKIYSKQPFVDVKLISLLTELENSNLIVKIEDLEWVKFNPEKEPTIHFLAKEIYDYFILIEKINVFIKTKYK